MGASPAWNPDPSTLKPIQSAGWNPDPSTLKPIQDQQSQVQKDQSSDEPSMWGKVKSYFADAKAKSSQMNQDAQKMTPQQFAQAHPEMILAHPQGQDIAEDVKAGNYAKAIHKTVTSLGANAAPLALVGAATAPVAALVGTAIGMGSQYLGKKAATALGATPDQADVAGDVTGIAGGITGGAVAGEVPGLLRSGVQSAKESVIGQAATQTLPNEIADQSLSTTTRGASTGRVATNITPREVLQHAASEGIDLTPAQALQTSAAKTEQTFGEEALATGGKIGTAIAKNKAKLAASVDDFQDRLDPQRIGLSSEATGEHLQNSAEVAKSVLKDNVNDAYSQVKEQQADLAGDVQAPLQQLIHDESFARQPHAAVEQPIFQTGAAKAAISDINGMLQDPALQGRQSIQSMRNLRTTLLEKGNDYGSNAVADSGQRIYKLAAGKVDDAIMQAAKGTPFEQTFREAGSQNAKLQSLYNSRGSPLYRILNTDDPAKVADGILNRSSVQEIEALKGEGIDTAPLARQAVEDIKNNGFKVTSDGLGGYPDTFLRSLLGPDQTKELYLKSEIARRLAENYNPSGSGKVVLGASQLMHPVAAVAAQAARARSMPQVPTKYLGLQDLLNKGPQ